MVSISLWRWAGACYQWWQETGFIVRWYSKDTSIDLDPHDIELNDVNTSPDSNDEGEWVFNEDTFF